MFVCKFGIPSCSNYEHFHVYLAYRRQTGTMVTRQTYDRAPRLTKPPTAHISRGDSARRSSTCKVQRKYINVSSSYNGKTKRDK